LPTAALKYHRDATAYQSGLQQLQRDDAMRQVGAM
jgi:hypothetical protein